MADDVLWPIFDKLETQKASLPKEVFVETLQTAKKGVDNIVGVLSRELSSQKFFVVTTNSWFEGVDKADEFEFNDMVIKVTEEKEYL